MTLQIGEKIYLKDAKNSFGKISKQPLRVNFPAGLVTHAMHGFPPRGPA